MARNWEDIIPSYMAHYNSYFRNPDGDKYHLLFVEGKGDNEYFYDFFNKAYEKTNGEYDLRILREDILFDFSNKFKSVDSFGRLTYGKKRTPNLTEEELNNLKLSKKEIVNKINQATVTVNKNGKTVKVLNGRTPYQNFYFVLECLKEFNNHNYGYIDCFGFVDRDCNQHDSVVRNNNQLSQTKYHDRETNLIRNKLISFVNKYAGNNVGATRKKIADILLFTTKQGLAERTSLMCGYGNQSLSNLTKNHFNNNPIKKCAMTDFTNLRFDEHLAPIYSDRFKILAKHNIESECNILFPKKKIKSESNFDTNLSKTIIEWLEGRTEHENVIDEIFRLSNGHYILQQLDIALFDRNRLFVNINDKSKLFDIDNEEDLLNLIFEDSIDDIDYIFGISPLRDYRNYRDNLRNIVRQDKNI